MKKKHDRRVRTHFEQIPVEVVKGITAADGPKDEKAGKGELNRAPTRSRRKRR
ncbi:MAG TPA: hypothetical protein VKY31_11305 [Terriglobia bacterium]|nr:hypothetical protein [Terriglobia bacterium]